MDQTNLQPQPAENNLIHSKNIIFLLFFVIILIVLSSSATYFYFQSKKTSKIPNPISLPTQSLQSPIQTIFPSSETAQGTVSVSSNIRQWPNYVNLEDLYSIRYPREWRVREIPFERSLPSYAFVKDKVSFGSNTTLSVYSGNQNLSVERWIKENINAKPGDQRYFENAKDLKSIKMSELEDTVSFLEERQGFCEWTCGPNILTYWIITKINPYFVGISCVGKACIESNLKTWNTMLDSFGPITESSTTEIINEWQQKDINLNGLNVTVSYPRDWFYKRECCNYDKFSNFDIEGFSTGSNTYGVTVTVNHCNSTLNIRDCLNSLQIQTNDLFSPTVENRLGRFIRRTDNQYFEGATYRTWTLLVSKQTKIPLTVLVEFSNYGINPQLAKRIGAYYDPAINQIIERIKIN